jgi:hypothetical protein
MSKQLLNRLLLEVIISNGKDLEVNYRSFKMYTNYQELIKTYSNTEGYNRIAYKVLSDIMITDIRISEGGVNNLYMILLAELIKSLIETHDICNKIDILDTYLVNYDAQLFEHIINTGHTTQEQIMYITVLNKIKYTMILPCVSLLFKIGYNISNSRDITDPHNLINPLNKVQHQRMFKNTINTIQHLVSYQLEKDIETEYQRLLGKYSDCLLETSILDALQQNPNNPGIIEFLQKRAKGMIASGHILNNCYNNLHTLIFNIYEYLKVYIETSLFTKNLIFHRNIPKDKSVYGDIIKKIRTIVQDIKKYLLNIQKPGDIPKLMSSRLFAQSGVNTIDTLFRNLLFKLYIKSKELLILINKNNNRHHFTNYDKFRNNIINIEVKSRIASNIGVSIGAIQPYVTKLRDSYSS